MILFPVSSEKVKALQIQMLKLGIQESDLLEEFIRGSGKGGQKRNKTSSCVQLVHRPSGIQIRCEEDRSQSMNRFLARRELCEKIAERMEGASIEKIQTIRRIRQAKAKRSKRAKERILRAKAQVSEKKQSRKRDFSRE